MPNRRELYRQAVAETPFGAEDAHALIMDRYDRLVEHHQRCETLIEDEK